MERRKWTVAVLSAATLVGVPAAEIRALDLSHEISPDAGAVAGTAIIQVADLGFMPLGPEVPVEVRQGRYAYLDPYRGGAVTLEDYGQAFGEG